MIMKKIFLVFLFIFSLVFGFNYKYLFYNLNYIKDNWKIKDWQVINIDNNNDISATFSRYIFYPLLNKEAKVNIENIINKQKIIDKNFLSWLLDRYNLNTSFTNHTLTYDIDTEDENIKNKIKNAINKWNPFFMLNDLHLYWYDSNLLNNINKIYFLNWLYYSQLYWWLNRAEYIDIDKDVNVSVLFTKGIGISSWLTPYYNYGILVRPLYKETDGTIEKMTNGDFVNLYKNGIYFDWFFYNKKNTNKHYYIKEIPSRYSFWLLPNWLLIIPYVPNSNYINKWKDFFEQAKSKTILDRWNKNVNNIKNDFYLFTGIDNIDYNSQTRFLEITNNSINKLPNALTLSDIKPLYWVLKTSDTSSSLPYSMNFNLLIDDNTDIISFNWLWIPYTNVGINGLFPLSRSNNSWFKNTLKTKLSHIKYEIDNKKNAIKIFIAPAIWKWWLKKVENIQDSEINNLQSIEVNLPKPINIDGKKYTKIKFNYLLFTKKISWSFWSDAIFFNINFGNIDISNLKKIYLLSDNGDTLEIPANILQFKAWPVIKNNKLFIEKNIYNNNDIDNNENLTLISKDTNEEHTELYWYPYFMFGHKEWTNNIIINNPVNDFYNYENNKYVPKSYKNIKNIAILLTDFITDNFFVSNKNLISHDILFNFYDSIFRFPGKNIVYKLKPKEISYWKFKLLNISAYNSLNDLDNLFIFNVDNLQENEKEFIFDNFLPTFINRYLSKDSNFYKKYFAFGYINIQNISFDKLKDYMDKYLSFINTHIVFNHKTENISPNSVNLDWLYSLNRLDDFILSDPFNITTVNGIKNKIYNDLINESNVNLKIIFKEHDLDSDKDWSQIGIFFYGLWKYWPLFMPVKANQKSFDLNNYINFKVNNSNLGIQYFNWNNEVKIPSIDFKNSLEILQKNIKNTLDEDIIIHYNPFLILKTLPYDSYDKSWHYQEIEVPFLNTKNLMAVSTKDASNGVFNHFISLNNYANWFTLKNISSSKYKIVTKSSNLPILSFNNEIEFNNFLSKIDKYLVEINDNFYISKNKLYKFLNNPNTNNTLEQYCNSENFSNDFLCSTSTYEKKYKDLIENHILDINKITNLNLVNCSLYNNKNLITVYKIFEVNNKSYILPLKIWIEKWIICEDATNKIYYLPLDIYISIAKNNEKLLISKTMDVGDFINLLNNKIFLNFKNNNDKKIYYKELSNYVVEKILNFVPANINNIKKLQFVVFDNNYRNGIYYNYNSVFNLQNFSENDSYKINIKVKPKVYIDFIDKINFSKVEKLQNNNQYYLLLTSLNTEYLWYQLINLFFGKDSTDYIRDYTGIIEKFNNQDINNFLKNRIDWNLLNKINVNNFEKIFTKVVKKYLTDYLNQVVINIELENLKTWKEVLLQPGKYIFALYTPDYLKTTNSLGYEKLKEIVWKDNVYLFVVWIPLLDNFNKTILLPYVLTISDLFWQEVNNKKLNYLIIKFVLLNNYVKIVDWILKNENTDWLLVYSDPSNKDLTLLPLLKLYSNNVKNITFKKNNKIKVLKPRSVFNIAWTWYDIDVDMFYNSNENVYVSNKNSIYNWNKINIEYKFYDSGFIESYENKNSITNIDDLAKSLLKFRFLFSINFIIYNVNFNTDNIKIKQPENKKLLVFLLDNDGDWIKDKKKTKKFLDYKNDNDNIYTKDIYTFWKEDTDKNEKDYHNIYNWIFDDNWQLLALPIKIVTNYLIYGENINLENYNKSFWTKKMLKSYFTYQFDDTEFNNYDYIYGYQPTVLHNFLFTTIPLKDIKSKKCQLNVVLEDEHNPTDKSIKNWFYTNINSIIINGINYVGNITNSDEKYLNWKHNLKLILYANNNNNCNVINITNIDFINNIWIKENGNLDWNNVNTKNNNTINYTINKGQYKIVNLNIEDLNNIKETGIKFRFYYNDENWNKYTSNTLDLKFVWKEDINNCKVKCYLKPVNPNTTDIKLQNDLLWKYPITYQLICENKSDKDAKIIDYVIKYNNNVLKPISYNTPIKDKIYYLKPNQTIKWYGSKDEVNKIDTKLLIKNVIYNRNINNELINGYYNVLYEDWTEEKNCSLNSLNYNIELYNKEQLNDNDKDWISCYVVEDNKDIKPFDLEDYLNNKNTNIYTIKDWYLYVKFYKTEYNDLDKNLGVYSYKYTNSTLIPETGKPVWKNKGFKGSAIGEYHKVTFISNIKLPYYIYINPYEIYEKLKNKEIILIEGKEQRLNWFKIEATIKKWIYDTTKQKCTYNNINDNKYYYSSNVDYYDKSIVTQQAGPNLSNAPTCYYWMDLKIYLYLSTDLIGLDETDKYKSPIIKTDKVYDIQNTTDYNNKKAWYVVAMKKDSDILLYYLKDKNSYAFFDGVFNPIYYSYYKTYIENPFIELWLPVKIKRLVNIYNNSLEKTGQKLLDNTAIICKGQLNYDKIIYRTVDTSEKENASKHVTLICSDDDGSYTIDITQKFVDETRTNLDWYWIYKGWISNYYNSIQDYFKMIPPPYDDCSWPYYELHWFTGKSIPYSYKQESVITGWTISWNSEQQIVFKNRYKENVHFEDKQVEFIYQPLIFAKGWTQYIGGYYINKWQTKNYIWINDTNKEVFGSDITNEDNNLKSTYKVSYNYNYIIPLIYCYKTINWYLTDEFYLPDNWLCKEWYKPLFYRLLSDSDLNQKYIDENIITEFNNNWLITFDNDKFVLYIYNRSTFDNDIYIGANNSNTLYYQNKWWIFFTYDLEDLTNTSLNVYLTTDIKPKNNKIKVTTENINADNLTLFVNGNLYIGKNVSEIDANLIVNGDIIVEDSMIPLTIKGYVYVSWKIINNRKKIAVNNYDPLSKTVIPSVRIIKDPLFDLLDLPFKNKFIYLKK